MYTLCNTWYSVAWGCAIHSDRVVVVKPGTMEMKSEMEIETEMEIKGLIVYQGIHPALNGLHLSLWG